MDPNYQLKKKKKKKITFFSSSFCVKVNFSYLNSNNTFAYSASSLTATTKIFELKPIMEI